MSNAPRSSKLNYPDSEAPPHLKDVADSLSCPDMLNFRLHHSYGYGKDFEQMILDNYSVVEETIGSEAAMLLLRRIRRLGT